MNNAFGSCKKKNNLFFVEDYGLAYEDMHRKLVNFMALGKRAIDMFTNKSLVSK